MSFSITSRAGGIHLMSFASLIITIPAITLLGKQPGIVALPILSRYPKRCPRSSNLNSAMSLDLFGQFPRTVVSGSMLKIYEHDQVLAHAEVNRSRKLSVSRG
jgi:hypothetical protein